MELIIALILFLLSPVFVEGATELVTKSLLFSNFRERLSQKGEFFATLIGCGFCTSVWVSIPPAASISIFLLLDSPFFIPLLFVFLTVVIHRMSNYVHNINDKHLDKFYDKDFYG